MGDNAGIGPNVPLLVRQLFDSLRSTRRLKCAAFGACLLTMHLLWVGNSSAAPEIAVRQPQVLFPAGRLTLISTSNARTILSVELATTAERWRIGLSDRSTLDENAGMLFVFDRDDLWSFWMRGTSIPLSIAFIAADGRIVDIQNMLPYDETFHTSARPARMALEVNQGYFAINGIGVGDLATLWQTRSRVPMLTR